MPRIQLVAVIILSAITTYFLTYIVHGSIHELLAYCNGLTDTPFIGIADFQGWLQNVRENSEFANADPEGSYFKIGIVGFGGYIVNWILLIFAMLKLPKVTNPNLTSFLYWLAIWNLTAVFGYIPHHLFNSINISRTFSSIGVSIWMVYIIGGFLALVSIYIMFYIRLPEMLDKLQINRVRDRRIYFAVSILIVLFYSTFRFIFMLDDELSSLIYNRLLLSLASYIFWFKLALLTVICFHIRLRNKAI